MGDTRVATLTILMHFSYVPIHMNNRGTGRPGTWPDTDVRTQLTPNWKWDVGGAKRGDYHERIWIDWSSVQ